MRNIKNELGFSLIELMTVVVILGGLVAIGFPKYEQFLAKSRQAEAKNNIPHIAMLEDIFKLEYGKWETMSAVGNSADNSASGTCSASLIKNKLGFRPKNCEELRYGYTVAVTPAPNQRFDIVVSRKQGDKLEVYPRCDEQDSWNYNSNNGNANNNPNILDSCP